MISSNTNKKIDIFAKFERDKIVLTTNGGSQALATIEINNCFDGDIEKNAFYLSFTANPDLLNGKNFVYFNPDV